MRLHLERLTVVLCGVLWACAFPLGADAKLVTGSFVLDGVSTEHFMAKFSFGIGTGRISGRFWVENDYNDPRELELYYFCDDEWPAAQKALTCRDKVALARDRDRLAFEKHATADGENELGKPARVSQVFRVNKNFTMHIRTHYWYFMIADCTLEEYFHKVPRIYYNLEIFNEPGDHHLPADEFGMARLHTLNAMYLAGCLVAMGYTVIQRITKSSSIHIAVLMLGSALLLGLLSSICELIHLGTYESNGIGSAFCDTLSALCESLCDFVVSFLLISIACGWTLNSTLPMSMATFGFSKKRQGIVELILSQLRNPKMFFRKQNAKSTGLLLGLFMYHVLLVIWGRRYGEEFDTFHDFEHTPGRLLLLFRCCAGILFFFASHSTRKRQGGVGEIASFLFMFQMVGVGWFFSLPAMVVIASITAEYLRHMFISGGTMFLQNLACSGFVYLFLGANNSLFYRSSTAGKQGSVDLDSVPKSKFSLGISNRSSFAPSISNVLSKVRKTRVHVD
jgi:hypothetical protein|eukprot:g3358.t1